MDKKTKIKLLPVFSIVLLIVCFSSNYKIYTGSSDTVLWKLLFYGKYLVGLSFVFILYRRNETDKNYKIAKKNIRNWMIVPVAACFLYSIIIWIVNDTAYDYIMRGVSTILYKIIAIYAGISFACIFKENAIKYILYASILFFVITMALGIIRDGNIFLVLTEGVYNSQGQRRINYFELHEVIFIIGLFLVYYLAIKKDRISYILLTAIVEFILGLKRIGLAALLLSMFVSFLAEKKGIIVKKIWIFICKVGGMIFCIVYVWFSASTELNQLFARYGINMMGRNILYSYFRNFCTFSFDYMGHGIGFVSKQFDYATVKELYNMLNVSALHNDLFKLYIEVGFCGFIIWCWYWLFYMAKKIEKQTNINTTFYYILIIIYVFITYTTDNTEGYYNFQFVLAVVLFNIYLEGIKEKKSKRGFYEVINNNTSL